MAIKIQGTTIIDDSRNIGSAGIVTATTFVGDLTGTASTAQSLSGTPNLNVGVVSATSFVGNLTGTASTASFATTSFSLSGSPNLSVGIVTASGGFNIGIQSAGQDVTTGVVTAFNFVGAGNTFLYNAGTKTIDISIAGGGGGSTGPVDGQAFNTGITSSFNTILTGIGDTILTIPSTAGKEYIVYSIHASNVAVGNTEVNVIGAFDFNGGERSYFAYNIPVPTGLAVELLNRPQILNPSDRIVMRATDFDRVGIDSGIQVFVTYQEKTSTEYLGLGFGPTTGITTTAVIGILTATTYPVVLESIRLTNTTDLGGYPISVTVTTGVTTRSLVENLIVPKYANIELLETPKRLNLNDVLKIQVTQLATIDVQVSGKQITS